MSNTLAINGGKPVFAEKELNSLTPSWPIAYPETEQKLLELYRSGKWGCYSNYEKQLMPAFAKFQDAKKQLWRNHTCGGPALSYTEIFYFIKGQRPKHTHTHSIVKGSDVF